MEKFIGRKVLITAQNYFVGRDGKQYRAVHGTLRAVHETSKTLGFIPNRSHANWFIEVGDMIIMGCQVMYFEQVDQVVTASTKDWKDDEKGGVIEFSRPTIIYTTT
jgi:hypothetical protein